MDTGWIKLHRKILENPIIMRPELLQLFIYCLLKANHEPKKIIFNSQELIVDVGQFITGREVMAKELKQNGRTLYDRLKILEKLQILSIKTNNKFSLVTVVNYALYQLDNEKTNSNSNNEPTTSQQPANTNKNDNNYKNIYSAFFEQVWSMYPNKKGKGQVSDTQKKKLHEIGIDELARCIDRYKRTKEEWKQWQNGSTFFNSGYVDYLDKNFTEQEHQDQYRMSS